MGTYYAYEIRYLLATIEAVSAEAWTEIEREYSPSSMVRSLTALTDRYRTESERVPRELPCRTYSYGDDASETLDFSRVRLAAPRMCSSTAAIGRS